MLDDIPSEYRNLAKTVQYLRKHQIQPTKQKDWIRPTIMIFIPFVFLAMFFSSRNVRHHESIRNYYRIAWKVNFVWTLILCTFIGIGITAYHTGYYRIMSNPDNYLVTSVVTGSAASSSAVSHSAVTDSAVSSSAVSLDEPTSEAVSESDTPKSFTLTLNDSVYKLPCHVDELINNGWSSVGEMINNDNTDQIIVSMFDTYGSILYAYYDKTDKNKDIYKLELLPESGTKFFDLTKGSDLKEIEGSFKEGKEDKSGLDKIKVKVKGKKKKKKVEDFGNGKVVFNMTSAEVKIKLKDKKIISITIKSKN
jgi:hypothetical protein